MGLVVVAVRYCWGEQKVPPCGSAVRTLPQQYLMRFSPTRGRNAPRPGITTYPVRKLLLWFQ